MITITKRCHVCGGENVVRDASAKWHEAKQHWVLGDVFDAAWCADCERDVETIDSPAANRTMTTSAAAAGRE